MTRIRPAAFALLFLLTAAQAARPQTVGTGVHEVEGQVSFMGERVGQVRVRLLRMPEARPIAETFTRKEGQFRFTHLAEGEYAIETFETEKFEAALKNVSVNPLVRNLPTTFRVSVELSEKASEGDRKTPPPGVVMADVDADVPRKAVEHYLAGVSALRSGDSKRAVAEFKKAIAAHPNYYAARLEYGRELRRRGELGEAEAVLRPLREIAPRKVEPRVDYALVLLDLGRREEAVAELEFAAGIAGAGWEPHYYLGWALLETRTDDAVTHLLRAVELDEAKAARAHLALARIAHERGQRDAAVKHLESFLALSPDSREAAAARALADKLRAGAKP
jgi:tetratricopeptide (TPR) repeat protein